MTIHRRLLPDTAGISLIPIRTGLTMSWINSTRVLLVHNYGHTMQRRIPPQFDAVAINIRNGNVRTVHPARSPGDPVARAAWAHGFFRIHRAASVAEAFAARLQARAQSGQDALLVHDGGEFPVFAKKFMFVFQVTADGHKRPFRWAASPETDPDEIYRCLERR